MTFVSGLVDAVAFLGLGHLFVAMVTGNIMFLGFTVAGAPGHSVILLGTAVASFFVGALAGARLGQPAGRGSGQDAGRPPPPLAVATAVYAGLLVSCLALAAAVEVGSGPGRHALVTGLAVAMGLQNATARRLAMPDIPTNVLTTQLTMIAAGSRLASGSGHATRRRVAAPAVMFSGALVGAATLRAVGVVAPLAIASALAIAVTVSAVAGPVDRARGGNKPSRRALHQVDD
ncbi:DUF1275 domain-containing protein [Frankia sp. CNm7]|uniref:DUF1275 domain-containing protein n=2 Tax=Frankia nepalensis TaxID=1836974 RepID=A0A937UJK9_9ACTN|nr:DUF1275 domain-containing protein [Frankia nepalensis]MBL7513876.1 DUF1275 domain-containing protein [Frankia nepalensis]MBL7523158.1 DUF1275 domain-containing protein [Frankia nepalensis]MBL7625904.1 DUF1275 domain-containing protein [Frankia nepalensis]